MYASVVTAALKGLESFPVRVEVDLSAGLPAFFSDGASRHFFAGSQRQDPPSDCKQRI